MQTLHGAINGHDTAEVGESEEQHETKKKNYIYSQKPDARIETIIFTPKIILIIQNN